MRPALAKAGTVGGTIAESSLQPLDQITQLCYRAQLRTR